MPEPPVLVGSCGKMPQRLARSAAVARKRTGTGDITRADTAAVAIATLGNAAAIGKTFEVIADENEPLNAWRKGFAVLEPDAR